MRIPVSGETCRDPTCDCHSRMQSWLYRKRRRERAGTRNLPTRESLVHDLAAYALLVFSCLALVYSLSG